MPDIRSRASFEPDIEGDCGQKEPIGLDVLSLLGCTHWKLTPLTGSDCFPVRYAIGSPESFPGGRQPHSGWPGRRSPRASTASVSPTGTGKTLAAFLAVLDRLFHASGRSTQSPGLRCVYVSPLRSLNYDIERNLAIPLAGIDRLSGSSRQASDPRRRADGRYLGLLPPQAARPAAAHPDHHAGEPLAAA